MKQLKMIMILACVPFVMVTAQEEPIPMDTLSYSLGMLQAMELKKQGVTELDQASYLEALNKVMSNEKTAIHGGAAKQFVREYVNNQKEKLDKMNLEAGMNYLEENGKRDEVTVLESGLQYEVIQEGTGEIPSAHSTVTTHYTGSLIDGSIFDSSVQRGEPLKFPVGGVIQGWQEALQLMPKGSKWKLYIPQDLAYGARGAGAVIPPYSALIFEIELLEVE